MPLYHDGPEADGPDIVIGIEVDGEGDSDYRESDYIRSPEEIEAEHEAARLTKLPAIGVYGAGMDQYIRDQAELGGRVADHLVDEQRVPGAWVQDWHDREEFRARQEQAAEREAG